MTEDVKIDTDLYSRQIGTFGMEMMGKLEKMDVLVIGLRGVSGKSLMWAARSGNCEESDLSWAA